MLVIKSLILVGIIKIFFHHTDNNKFVFKTYIQFSYL